MKRSALFYPAVVFFFVLFMVLACSSEDMEDPVTDGDLDAEMEIEGEGDAEAAVPQVVSDAFKVRATVNQVYIWMAEPDTDVELLDAEGSVLRSGTTDYQGSLVMREVEAGRNYVLRLKDNPDEYTDQLHVMTAEESYPDASFYEQQVLEPGFGYIETRDGTLLSIFVSLPGPVDKGPYPTVVNYSGYSPSQPGQSLGEDVEMFCGSYPVLCDAPNHPTGIIAGAMGYASVGVNLRGTGCSGGAYDYFEPLQLLDGYDVIEIVARQQWVKHHKVGMVGLSYPGITQLFVASVNPPSLAAIAPFSVIADTATSTLTPGGIYNNGFALEWIDMVLNKSEPYAHGWITDLVEAGDTICEEHQLLHSQKEDAIQKALDHPFYTDDVAAPLDPTRFVDKIDVPVFLVGQNQDEQTGPHSPILFGKFDNAPVKRFTMANGVHPDGLSPQVLIEWAYFLSFYVNEEIPVIDPFLYILVPQFMNEVFRSPGMELPENRFAEYTDFDQALADYEADPDIRVIFESGAHEDVDPGAPRGRFDQHFSEWPIPETEELRLYFQPDGSLNENEPPAEGGASSFEHDPEAGERVTLVSGSIDIPQPNYDYRPLIEGKAISFITEPMSEDVVMIGSASVDLWLQSTAEDADLEVNITEVRADGMETYVQSGWLRASRRNLLPESTALRPVSSHYEEDSEMLVDGEWNLVRVEVMPFTQIFRAGSRLRVSVDTPGDSRARWRFLLLDYDEPPTHSVAHMKDYPSSILLPVIPNVDIPTEQTACDALRGQPCREYVEIENTVME